MDRQPTQRGRRCKERMEDACQKEKRERQTRDREEEQACHRRHYPLGGEQAEGRSL